MTSRFGTKAPRLFGLLGSEMQIRAFAYFMFKTLRAKGLAGSMDRVRFLLSQPRSWLEETFEHRHIRALPGAWGMTSPPMSRAERCFPILRAWPVGRSEWS